jgi:hypothetical protein
MTRLVGLYREAEFSPGRHRSNDARLLERVGEALRARGCDVALMTLDEAEARGAAASAALIFSMCQGPSALRRLCAWERDGIRLVNSPRAALNTYRDRLASVMGAAGVAFPPTTLLPTSDAGDAAARVNGGMWLKRGDVHASVTADVQWIGSAAALRTGLAEFASRGIAQAAIQPHAPGDEIKFYGVAGGRFFHWFYPAASRGFPVDAGALRALVETAAGAAGLDIYGGDVIVAPSGALTLIDLNDWPSFAPCRDEAAGAIADFVARRVNGVWNSGLVSSANPGAV